MISPRRLLETALFSATLYLCLLAAPPSVVTAQPTELVAQFESRTHSIGTFELPYRLFVPAAYDSTKKYPLVLAFHGAGERGTNNTTHISVHRLATAWADTRVQSLYSPFVVAPQAPPGGRWENVITSGSGVAGIRPEMTTVLAILDSLEIEFNIDPDRIYVTGLSLGGYGTFDAVYRASDRFAAALPMSGGYSPVLAEEMKDVPFWIIHGETDGTVPPLLSKRMITAFEQLGRQTLYTNCDHFRCSPLSPEALDAALAARPELIFWGVPGVGHGPWSPWFDNPRVQDWLMTQHRLTPGAAVITEPSEFTTLQGSFDLEWDAATPQDSVQVWFSPDRGATWAEVASGVFPDGALTIDTSTLPDTPLGMFQILAFNDGGFVYARDRSDVVAVDNAGDAAPVAIVDEFPFKLSTTFIGNSFDLPFYVGDAEQTDVDVTISYSVDDGMSYEEVEQFTVEPAGERVLRTVDLAALPNSTTARFRVEASDGVTTASDVTPTFSKSTTRQTSMYVEHAEGASTPVITISFVDEDALTGHRYRLTFTVAEDGSKTYDVTDADESTVVLAAVPVTPFEGPLFDGMRLTFADVATAEQNRDETGWTTGNATMNVSIRAPRVTLDGQSIQMLATPADYRLVITDAVSDTSSATFGFTAHETHFYLENLTAGERRDFLFDDKNGDGQPSSLETLYILEENAKGFVAPAWLFTFVNGNPIIAPEDGDVFTFVTTKPILENDVFDIYGAIGVAIEDAPNGNDLELSQNYPNPFGETTSIAFSLPTGGVARLTVFDALGRRVATVANRPFPAGYHTVTFQADALSAGLYFYRLEHAGASQTRSMVIAR